MQIHLTQQVLDQEVVDGNKQPLGKVDGIVLELRPRGRPRVAAIQIGAPVLAARLRQPMRGIIAWFARKCHAQTMTIPWQKVQDIGVDIEVHLEGQHPTSRDWEKWLSDHVVARIPFSS